MKIGERIICIDDTIKIEHMVKVCIQFPNWVKKDKIYTIRQINDNEGIVVGLLLEELHNPPIYIELVGREQEPAFAVWRFRQFTYQEQEFQAEKENKELQSDVILETMKIQN